MTTPALVSVIIPVWNGAAVLPEAVRSLQAQTYPHFEALIVDDGSTDDTAASALQLCETDPRLRLVPRPHSGISATRNAGMALAHGEYIAFLDADDVWVPQKLERQMKLFRADPHANFAFTNFYFWDGQRDLSAYYGDHRPLPEGDAARPLIFANVYGMMSTIVVKRVMFDRAGGFDPSLDSCEDWDMWLRLLEHGFWARGTREPLARYRRWSGNMSNKKIKMIQHDILALEKNLRATRRAELRPLYRRSLNYSHAKLELAQARQLLGTAPGKLPDAIWRAWRHYPQRLKWLLWYALLVWPKKLGGNATANLVHRKLIQKF